MPYFRVEARSLDHGSPGRETQLAANARVCIGVTTLCVHLPTSVLCSENEDAEKICKRHIHLLHKYNEAKDATQVSRVLITYIYIYLNADPNLDEILIGRVRANPGSL
jgi:hypothetical protein